MKTRDKKRPRRPLGKRGGREWSSGPRYSTLAKQVCNVTCQLDYALLRFFAARFQASKALEPETAVLTASITPFQYALSAL